MIELIDFWKEKVVLKRLLKEIAIHFLECKSIYK